jgi:tetratricopeptide (TPR) repeat protein
LLNNLASLYRATGAYAKAEPLYQRALAIYEKTLGPGHPTPPPRSKISPCC